ncbi:MAG TPA: hypothetical protein VH301_05730, partial [Usitatibacter sp.]|nr:hypothetical protein [Usitatibacter sp.]
MARDASPVTDPVLAELLDRHFAAQPRAMASALLSAVVCSWIMYGSMPTPMLAGWLAAFGIVNVVRSVTGRMAAATPLTQRGLVLRMRA